MTRRAFTVRGSRNGSLVHVTWTEGGTLTGDPPTVDLLHTQAEMLATLRQDSIGRRAFPELAPELSADDPLADPVSAQHLITHVLDSVRETLGDVAADAGAARKGGRLRRSASGDARERSHERG
jgi:hypothetical protein